MDVPLWHWLSVPRKKLDSYNTRMLRAISNKSWKQHPTKQQLYGHLLTISKTIQIRRIRHAGHRWRNKDKLISDVLPWTPTDGRASVGRPARTYLQQVCTDTGSSLENLPEAMDSDELWQREREGEREREKERVRERKRERNPCEHHDDDDNDVFPSIQVCTKRIDNFLRFLNRFW